MKKSKKTRIILFLFILLFYNCIDTDKLKNKILKEEYPYVLRSNSIKGIVDSCFTFDLDNPKGGLYIKLKNGDKLIAIRNSYPYYVFDNNEIKNLSLVDILVKGDSIFKPSYKDSLYVIKSNGFKYIYFLPTKEFNDSIFK